jgi:DNA-binding transcriptional LysR family regulator
MLNLARMRVLVELDRRGTMAAVADELGYTPSAISQQLAQLEVEVGRPLTEKAGRGLRLTDAGRLLASRGRELIARAESAEAELAALEGVAGTLRIAAYQTAARHLVVPAVKKLREEHPELDCRVADLDAEQALPLLRAAELDIVVAEEYEHAPRPRYPDLERHDLLDDELVMALPKTHRAARGRGTVRLEDLAGERWATAYPDTAYAEMLVRICRLRGGFEPDVRHRVNDMETLLELAAGGLAIVLAPSMGRPERHPELTVKRLDGPRVSRSVFAAARKDAAARPAVAALLDRLQRR